MHGSGSLRTCAASAERAVSRLRAQQQGVCRPLVMRAKRRAQARRAPRAAQAVSAPPDKSGSPRAGGSKMPRADEVDVEHVLSHFGPETERDESGRLLLRALSWDELGRLLGLLGVGAHRQAHIWRWIHKYNIQVLEEARGTAHAIGKDLRSLLLRVATLDTGMVVHTVHRASDGTRKMVLMATEGPNRGRTAEAVVIPMDQGPDKKPRYTLCVSSQVGCAMGCEFCHTGKMGLLGNLRAAEILEQLSKARRLLQDEGDSVPIRNIVYMGMGEPFHNMEAVLRSLDVITARPGDGAGISARSITVSTVGLVPEIRRFHHEAAPTQLAVSLHAPNDELRSRIVPVNRRYDLAELMGTLRELYPLGADARGGSRAWREARERAGGGKPRFVIFEYTMLAGVNDSVECAQQLVELVRGVFCMVNLISFNTHEGAQFQGSSPEAMAAFRAVLRDAGLVCTIRESRGDDEMAACGQLGDLAMAGAAKKQ